MLAVLHATDGVQLMACRTTKGGLRLTRIAPEATFDKRQHSAARVCLPYLANHNSSTEDVLALNLFALVYQPTSPFGPVFTSAPGSANEGFRMRSGQPSTVALAFARYAALSMGSLLVILLALHHHSRRLCLTARVDGKHVVPGIEKG